MRLPDGRPAPGAEVVLLPEAGAPASLDAFRPPADRPVEEAAPPGPAVSRTLLGDLFDLGSRGLEAPRPYTGVPRAHGRRAAPAPVGRTGAAADGSFEIRTAEPGPFRVRATLEGAGSGEKEAVAADGPPVTIVLGATAPVRGVVLEADSREPIVGARVLVERDGVTIEAVTGAGGAFRVPDVPAGLCTIVAGATGRAPARVEGVAVAPGGKRVEILLGTRGRSLRVLVREREVLPWNLRRERHPGPGPPVPEALVVALHRETGSFVSAAAGPGGIAVLGPLGEGTWRVRAHREGFGAGGAGDVRLGEGSPPEEFREVLLSRLVRKPIRVVDATGAPLPDARAFWAGPDGDFDPEFSESAGTTGGDGLVVVAFDEGVARRSVLWILPREGAALALRPEDASSGTAEEVVAGPGRIVRGTVADGEGRAVPGARVHLRVQDPARDLDLGLWTRTDPSGTYAFPRVPFAPVVVWVEADFAFAEVERDGPPGADPLVVDLRLENPWDE